MRSYVERMWFLVKARTCLSFVSSLRLPIRPITAGGRRLVHATGDAKEPKALQKENARLKKMVAEQVMDMEILKEAAKGNW